MPANDKAQTRAAAALLRAAAAFTDDQWCQGDLAQDASGRETRLDSANIARRCARGQLRRALQQDHRPILEVIAAMAVNDLLPPNRDLTAWNDQPGRRPEEVRRLFRKAAEELEQEA